MRYVVLILLLSVSTAAADERAVLYGTWGTAKQCARAPITPGGSVLAAPFEISPLAVRQGPVACMLKWFPIAPRENGLFTGAFAQCGEDAVRDYFLRMELSGHELTLRWGLLHANGPLTRCPGS